MPVAAVSLRPLFPSQAPRIPIPRSPPPRCRVSRLTGIILHCVGKAVHVRGEPSGSWSSPCFHSLGTSCARKGMLFNKKRACYSIRPELVTLHETDKSRMKFFSTASWELSMRSRGGALTARGFRGLLPGWEQCPACLRGSRSRGAFPAGLYFRKEFGSFGKGRGGGEKPSPLCLLGEEPLADSSLGRLEGCAEASSRSAARGGWGPLPCSALWSPVRQC